MIDSTGSAQSPLLTQADVPPLPKKLKKHANDAEKAARTDLMQRRRKIQEQLREQQRNRTRPSNDDESTRRAVSRALKASAVVLSEAEAAVDIQLTRPSEEPTAL